MLILFGKTGKLRSFGMLRNVFQCISLREDCVFLIPTNAIFCFISGGNPPAPLRKHSDPKGPYSSIHVNPTPKGTRYVIPNTIQE